MMYWIIAVILIFLLGDAVAEWIYAKADELRWKIEQEKMKQQEVTTPDESQD